MAKPCIYIEYRTHDGQPVWLLKPERLEYSFQLGSQGPGTMSHFTPLSEPTITPNIIAPKRNDYMLKWTNDDGQTFLDVQGGFLWDEGIDVNDFGVQYSGVDWSAWLDNPFPRDWLTITQSGLLANYTLLRQLVIGLPVSPYDWFNNGAGASQQTIISNLLSAIGADGPNAVSFSPSFTGSYWVNVPGQVEGLPGGEFFQIQPFDTSPIRQHIANLSTLNDPWVPNFRTYPNKVLEFFFMKNKDPDQSIIPDFVAQDETVIHHIDWQKHGPIGTYVTGYGVTNFPKWFTTQHVPSEEKFRRWRSSHTLGSRGKFGLTQKEVEQGTLAFADKYPQTDLTMTIYPDKLDPISQETGFFNLCGYVVDVFYDFEVNTVDGVFYIISQNFHSDVAGNWLCDLGLQQIYQF